MIGGPNESPNLPPPLGAARWSGGARGGLARAPSPDLGSGDVRVRQTISARTPVPRALFAFVLAALLTAWSGSVAEAKRPPVRIGALHNLSGPLGSIGRPSLAGARLAVEQLNAGGGLLGRRVTLVARDGRSDPAVVRAKARQLVRP